MRRSIVRIAILALAVAVVGLVAAPETDASCSPAKLASNSGYAVGGYGYQYLNFAGNTSVGNFVGRFWQTDSPSLNNETTPGGFNINTQMFKAVDDANFPDSWVFNLNLGSQGNGCPTGCMTLYIEDPVSGRAIMWTAPEGGSTLNSLNFNFTYDEHGAVNAPQGFRPRVTSSSRAGTTVNVQFEVPDIAPNVRTSATQCGPADGAVTARRVFIQQAATAPSTDLPGAWTQLGLDAALAGPASARANPFDCSNLALDWWLATGILVNGQPPRFVTTPVRIECDPNLADPHGTFQKIDRPGTPAPRKQTN